MFRTPHARLACLLTLPGLFACGDDLPSDEVGVETSGGDGDGDSTTAPGDGDPTTSTGDGDGDPTTTATTGDGDGDGDPTTSGDGDGDGDPTTTSGDGDGDPTTTSGDGDGDPQCGPECCPGEFSCDGEQSLQCNEDGTAWQPAELCDGLQGLSCNADTGTCDGACAEGLIGLSYIGCDYYPTVTLQYDFYNTAPKDVFAVAVANTGDEDAMVIVTRGDNMVLDTVVPANSVEVIELPWVDALTKGTGPTAITVDGAYRLRSDRPVVVYQYNPLQSTTTNDSSLLLPSNAWGEATMVASWPQWTNIPGFYAVVAHEDDTTVTVAAPPNGTTVSAGAGIAANGAGQVVLDESDVLQVITSGSGDLTGSLITADKPIQVIGGHKCTNVPSNVSACDHLEEALFPIQTLADEYIVVPPAQVPLANLAKAQMVRVIATEANTSVTFTPDQGVDQVLADAGDFVQLSLSTAAFRVTADKPLLVVQYMVGQSAGYGTSDPAMVQAVTPKQFRTDYLFFAAPSWTANYVDIIAPNNASVNVDGQAAGGWIAIPGTGYSYTHVQLSNAGDGTHTVSSNQQVGISVYGVQSAGSYWYPGGLDLTINPQ